MSIKPETIGSEVEKGVWEIVARGKLLHADDAEVIGLLDAINKLEKADRFKAAHLRGYVRHMCGDIQGALESIGLKFAEPTTNVGVAFDACAFLSNLGYTVEAQQYYETAAPPQTGNFSRSVELGLATGSIHTLCDFIAIARKMNLSNLDRVPIDALESAARILGEAGISDELLARLMAIVGGVLREHGLMFHGTLGFEVFDVTEEATTVRLRYEVDTPMAEAIGLEMAFVDKLIDANVTLPPEITFTIQGVRA